MDFLAKLDFLMDRFGLTKTTLSQKSGIPYTTIDAWYKKGYEGLKLTTLRKIASFFNTTLDSWVLDEITDPNYGKASGFTVEYEEMEHIKKYRDLDEHGKDMVDVVLEKEHDRYVGQIRSTLSIVKDDQRDIISLPYYQQLVSAGNGQVYYDDPSAEYHDVYLTPTNRLANFMVSVLGDSMEPLYRNEDTVYVQKMDAVDIGDIGIFLVDGEMYIKERGEDRLISRNKNCPDIPLSGKASVICAGKVLGKCKEFVEAPYYDMDSPEITKYFDALKHYQTAFPGAAASKGIDKEGYDVLDIMGKDMKKHIDNMRKGIEREDNE